MVRTQISSANRHQPLVSPRLSPSTIAALAISTREAFFHPVGISVRDMAQGTRHQPRMNTLVPRLRSRFLAQSPARPRVSHRVENLVFPTSGSGRASASRYWKQPAILNVAETCRSASAFEQWHKRRSQFRPVHAEPRGCAVRDLRAKLRSTSCDRALAMAVTTAGDSPVAVELIGLPLRSAEQYLYPQPSLPRRIVPTPRRCRAQQSTSAR